MNTLLLKLLVLKNSRRGVTALEYGLIAALIAAVIMTAVGTIGSKLNTVFSSIGTDL
ncbi:Flp/Fap pilin component [Gluconacetobacter diazotrophicus PA1 5]|uniref:Flp family type IVb pilin n=2 Tax=Gluconacetobacter diazotrophicus TaxID=33996 RepID=A0A7W4FE26_GLUDI|nr:Flp family type IVb pilin [Gluconacetobacter diazotrophicus]ACI53209.1 Flp/Fap pilin component [Gluconacetobacter diazotrophicus PA1 5]MBB2156040.1 Flp family type IVb pilin [Gluconacetobacter diazotrophicus]TWB10417.1 pilus assembly protein Flp/PilA [Gluconacetobacter diazotrophicus]CAP55647.1 putative Flp/Fap pilin component [Gluconacetobacter diazotrophicus PA1 5]